MPYRIIKVSSRCKLETQLNYLVCRTDKETRILLDEISVVIIENPQICITGSLISELMSHKIRVIFCDLKHNPQGELEPYDGCFDAPAKLNKQINWSKETTDKVWQTIIKMKIRNQLSCMQLHGSPPERVALLQQYMSDVKPGDPDNREGQAARVYFNTVFGEDFDRRDEFDVRNTFLNYGYSMMLSLVNREISSYGYSNLIGIHHKGSENPFNLGCDFVEPLRPFIDDFVLSNNLEVETFKKPMLEALTAECRCGEKTMIIQNAVNTYILSLLSSINTNKPESIIDVGFKDGRLNV